MLRINFRSFFERSIVIGCLLLFGFGCKQVAKVPVEPEKPLQTYTSSDYAFALDYRYPFEVKERDVAIRPQTYLGLDTSFFASVRDLVTDTTPMNLAYVYAYTPARSVDELIGALEKSGPGIHLEKKETMTIHGIEVTKLLSSTQSGDKKTHYVFDTNGSTIVFSVFLYLEDAFQPILDSLRPSS